MPILFYTTSVDPWKTVSEIQRILVKHKVNNFSIRNQGGWPVSVAFSINLITTVDLKHEETIPLNYLLPCQHMGVLAVLKKDREVGAKYATEEHALRVAWRIVKAWIDAQLAIVESGQVVMTQVFFPYLVIDHRGQTLYQHLLSGPERRKLLTFE